MVLLKKTLKKISAFFDRQNALLRRFKKQQYFDRRLVASLFRQKKLTLRHFKYLPRFLTKKEKHLAKFSLAIMIVCLVLLSGNLLLFFTKTIPQAGGEYVEAVIGSPRFINPILSQTNSVDGDLSRLVFSSLMLYDKDHKLIGDLAQSFEISEDQLVYTFHLRQDVKWHDGEAFNADDVVFTFSSIQDSEFKSPLGRRFRNVVCEKVDDFTVKFTLKESFAPFITMLTFGILPEHLWYNIPPANADLNELNKKPIGTGAWMVDSFKKDKNGSIKSYVLVPNKNFYGTKPYLKKLIFKFYGDNLSALEAVKSKNADGLSYLPRDLRDELKKHKNIVYHELEQPQYAGIFFNQKRNSLLQADYIRQALALAINKEKIITQVFSGDAKLLDVSILPGISNNPDVVKYPHNPEEAVSLLEKNGWSLVSTTTVEGLTQQFRVKKDFSLEITLTTADQPQYVAVAQIIKSNWEQIGFKVNLNIVDKTKIVADNIASRKYEALLFSQNMSSDPDPFAFWHSSQNEYPGANLAVFTNKQVDQLLEDGRKNIDLEKRTKNYWEFQKILAKELPVIFLYSSTYTYAQDKDIKGFDVSEISSYYDRFANINEWYIKTKRVLK